MKVRRRKRRKKELALRTTTMQGRRRVRARDMLCEGVKPAREPRLGIDPCMEPVRDDLGITVGEVSLRSTLHVPLSSQPTDSGTLVVRRTACTSLSTGS
jgi:hypothetical protein